MSLEAFKQRVLPTKDKLYRFAIRMMRDEDEAKDVVQEVLIKVWDRREKMDSWDNIEAWCMQITKNHILDKFKSKRYKLTDQKSEEFDIGDAKSRTTERITETKEKLKRINNIIINNTEKMKKEM